MARLAQLEPELVLQEMPTAERLQVTDRAEVAQVRPAQTPEESEELASSTSE